MSIVRCSSGIVLLYYGWAGPIAWSIELTVWMIEWLGEGWWTKGDSEAGGGGGWKCFPGGLANDSWLSCVHVPAIRLFAQNWTSTPSIQICGYCVTPVCVHHYNNNANVYVHLKIFWEIITFLLDYLKKSFSLDLKRHFGFSSIFRFVGVRSAQSLTAKANAPLMFRSRSPVNRIPLRSCSDITFLQ